MPVFSRIHLARFIFRTFHGTYSTWVNGGVKKVCLFSMFIFSMIHPSHCFHCLIVAIYFCCFKGPLAISKCDVSHFFCVLEKINKEISRTNSVLGNVHVMVCLHELYMDSLLCSSRCCSLNFISWWGCQRLSVSPPAMAYGSGTSTKKYRVVLSLIFFHEHRALSSSYLLTIAVTFFLRACAPCIPVQRQLKKNTSDVR